MTKLSVMNDAEQIASSLTGFRRQLLDALDTPDSATGLAIKVGSTRQRVNYHLRALEASGLIELAEVRQKRGLQERVMRRVSDILLVDPTSFAGVSLTANDTAGITAVLTTATDLIRHAAAVANEASEDGSRLATATLDTEVTLRSPSHMRMLLEEIGETISRYDSEEGLSMRVATTVLPTVEKPND